MKKKKKRRGAGARIWGQGWVWAAGPALQWLPWQLPRQWPREPISPRHVQILHLALAAHGACIQCAHNEPGPENLFPGATDLQLCCNEVRVYATVRYAKQRVYIAQQGQQIRDDEPGASAEKLWTWPAEWRCSHDMTRKECLTSERQGEQSSSPRK